PLSGLARSHLSIFCISRRPHTPPPFPSTTLFRSSAFITMPGPPPAGVSSTARCLSVACERMSIESSDQMFDVSAKHLVTRLDRRSEEHTSELQSLTKLVCRLLLEIKHIGTQHALT